MKKLGLLGIVLTMLVFGCKKDEKKPVVEDINIKNSDLELFLGEVGQVVMEHFPSDLAAPEYTYESTPADVVEISAEGKVTSIGVGDAVIKVTALDGKLADDVNVKVKPIATELIKLEIAEQEIIIEGRGKTYTAQVIPENATYKTVKWKSSAINVATVDEDGLVTAVAAGGAVITAYIEETEITASFHVKVIEDKVTGLSFEITEKTIEKGESFILTAIAEPEGVTMPELKWYNAGFMEMTEAEEANSIKITGTSVGNAMAYAALVEDENVKAECLVSVINVRPKEISVDKEEYTAAMGEYISPVITVGPEEAYGYQLEWTSSDEEVVKYENGNLVVTGKGTATVTLKVVDTDVSTSFTVVGTKVDLESITLVEETIEMQPYVNGDFWRPQVRVTFAPANASNKNVTFVSSDEDVVTVDNNGTLTGRKDGEADITVTAEDGGLTAVCHVIVKEVALEEIHIKMDYHTGFPNNHVYPVKNILVGTTQDLTWSYSPENVKRDWNHDLYVSSSDPEILSVSSNKWPIVLRGKKAGTVTVTVTDIKTQIKKSIDIKVGEIKDICEFTHKVTEVRYGSKKWEMTWKNNTNRIFKVTKVQIPGTSTPAVFYKHDCNPGNSTYISGVVGGHNKRGAMYITYEMSGKEYEMSIHKNPLDFTE